MAANLLAGKGHSQRSGGGAGIPRDAAKRINFGIIYGVGRKALAKQPRIPVEKAAEYLKKYHERYSWIPAAVQAGGGGRYGAWLHPDVHGPGAPL